MLTGKRDLAKAKELIQEAGYKGEKIVVLSATDQPIVHSQGLVTTELLRTAPASTSSWRPTTGAR